MAISYNYTKNGYNYYRKTKKFGNIRKEFYGKGKKDVEKQIEEYTEKIKSGLNVKASTLTVQEAMEHWLFDVLIHSQNKKSGSFEKHEANYRNYIKNKSIGKLFVQNAVSLPFQKYYNELYEKGINMKPGKTNKIVHRSVSSKKIADLNKTLRVFFNYCITQHYTLENPCSLKNIEIPGNADGEEDESDLEIEGNDIQAFSDEELNKITSNLIYKEDEDNTFNVAVQLSFLTGLRLGELLGLKKKFIEPYQVKVRNTIKRIRIFDSSNNWHRETKLIRPKSTTSIRNVPFATSFWPIIQKYLREQEIKYKQNDMIFNDDCLLFTTKTCNPIDMKNFYRAWQRFLNKIEIAYKTPHSIRDTYATMLIRKGALIHDVKSLLGHSSIKITEKYYIYVFPDDKAKVAELLSDFIKN